MFAALALIGGKSVGAAGWVWKPSFGEQRLVAEYETTDPWALRDAEAQLEEHLAAGYSSTSTVVQHDRQEIAAAKRAASPRWAHCQGKGRREKGGYYPRLWCSARLASSASAYEATVKVTLYPRGRQAFRVRSGFH